MPTVHMICIDTAISTQHRMHYLASLGIGNRSGRAEQHMNPI